MGSGLIQHVNLLVASLTDDNQLQALVMSLAARSVCGFRVNWKPNLTYATEHTQGKHSENRENQHST